MSRRPTTDWTPMMDARLISLTKWLGVSEAARILHISNEEAVARLDILGISPVKLQTPLVEDMKLRLPSSEWVS